MRVGRRSDFEGGMLNIEHPTPNIEVEEFEEAAASSQAGTFFQKVR
jgi:hypothetical protein